jgi:hypothetical protein
MSRPSFQFYTKDWRSNSKLRRCSPAARGVWIDILCALHDSDEYGIARYSLKELASEVGARLVHLRELVDKGVLKGADKGDIGPHVYVPRSGRKDGPPVTLLPVQAGPLWYSSRMVTDEYKNAHRGEGTRFGDGKDETPPPAPPPSPIQREGDGPSSSSSPAVRERDSEADASAEPSAGTPLSARERVWALGVSLLGEGGRGLLGKLAKAHGEDVLAKVLAEATLERPIEPKAWVIAACEAAAAKGKRNGHAPDSALALLDRDPRPPWAIGAGFSDLFDAETAGCGPGNWQKFRDGKRVEA